MKYVAVLDTDDYEDFGFFEDGKEKYLHAVDAYATNGEWIYLPFKPLEQEPTTKNDLGVDAVSRKDVHDMLENLPVTVENKWFNWLQKACMRLAELPSVTLQEPRWIPVSEKLPEPFTFVNATCRSLIDDRKDWVIETLYLPIPKKTNKYGYSDWGNIPMLNCGDAEVIAWVERIIPEPYKAGK